MELCEVPWLPSSLLECAVPHTPDYLHRPRNICHLLVTFSLPPLNQTDRKESTLRRHHAELLKWEGDSEKACFCTNLSSPKTQTRYKSHARDQWSHPKPQEDMHPIIKFLQYDKLKNRVEGNSVHTGPSLPRGWPRLCKLTDSPQVWSLTMLTNPLKQKLALIIKV